MKFVFSFATVNGNFTEWSAWSPCSMNCGKGKTTRFRTCTAPKPRCGGLPCDTKVLTKEAGECSPKCPGIYFAAL